MQSGFFIFGEIIIANMNTFEEYQSFRNSWIMMLLLAVAVGTLIAFYYLMSGEEVNMSTYLIVIICSLIGPLLIAIFSLTTQLTKREITIRFYPLSSKTIQWGEVSQAEIIDYGFVGGWGIRLGTKYGTVYNIKGSKGMHLIMKNGRQYIIGTQKPEKMKQWLEQNINIES